MLIARKVHVTLVIIVNCISTIKNVYGPISVTDYHVTYFLGLVFLNKPQE